MSDPKKPMLPRGLGPSGQRLWRAVIDTFELDAHEYTVLAAACRQADVTAELEAVVAEEGPMVAGSKGQSRLHPAVVEARQSRLATAALVARLGLPDSEGRSTTSPSQRGRRAANARWQRELREVG